MKVFGKKSRKYFIMKCVNLPVRGHRPKIKYSCIHLTNFGMHIILTVFPFDFCHRSGRQVLYSSDVVSEPLLLPAQAEPPRSRGGAANSERVRGGRAPLDGAHPDQGRQPAQWRGQHGAVRGVNHQQAVRFTTGVAVRSVPRFCLFCLLNCAYREDGP